MICLKCINKAYLKDTLFPNDSDFLWILQAMSTNREVLSVLRNIREKTPNLIKYLL
jgi:hypothetical protein